MFYQSLLLQASLHITYEYDIIPEYVTVIVQNTANMVKCNF